MVIVRVVWQVCKEGGLLVPVMFTGFVTLGELMLSASVSSFIIFTSLGLL